VAAALLGADHPLVRDLARLVTVANQSLVAAALFAGGVGALVTGSSAALPLVLAAAVAEVLFACRAAVLVESRRAHALDLISHGHGGLPIPVVEHMCARLRRPRHRQRLAESIEALVPPGAHQFDIVTAPWKFLAGDLAAAARHELREIAVLLREPDASVQGLAMIEQLLCDGTSSLHDDNVCLLREELRRVRFLLGMRSPGH
jgi:hypothetical protein